jgi:glycosyltransferase involved in cell wall biosynthesis
MRDCLISIIVPIYNPGQHLYKCLESLANQKRANFEVVLVDDGSTDDSGKICEEYCQKYNNFYYFYKENSGVSDTRNFGIEKSCGEYITFVDSDDYIDEKYTEKAEELIEQNYEMFVFNFVEVNGKNKCEKIFLEHSQDITCPVVLDKYFQTYFLSTCWKIFYKKSLVKNNDIAFKENINYGEDMLFSITAYLNSLKTYYLNYCGYFYVINETSATQTTDMEKRKKCCVDNIELYKQINLLLKEKNISISEDLFLDALLRNFVSGIDSLLMTSNARKYIEINEILMLYEPYLDKYKREKSALNSKLKLQIALLKRKNVFLMDVYFKVKKFLH